MADCRHQSSKWLGTGERRGGISELAISPTKKMIPCQRKAENCPIFHHRWRPLFCSLAMPSAAPTAVEFGWAAYLTSTVVCT